MRLAYFEKKHWASACDNDPTSENPEFLRLALWSIFEVPVDYSAKNIILREMILPSKILIRQTNKLKDVLPNKKSA